MSYATWLAEFPKFHAEYTCLRKGQAIFNWLSINNPELAVDLTGGELDCFYLDHKITAFLVYVEENWNKYYVESI